MRIRHLHVVVLLTTIALVPAVTRAEAPSPPPPSAAPSPAAAALRERFAGTFLYVGGEKEIAARNAAIEKATESMFFAIRGTARSKLRDSTEVKLSVRFAFGSGNISVFTPGEAAAVSPERGTPAAYKASSGTPMQLTQRLTPDGKIEQIFVSDSGTRSVVFALSADGLTLSAVHTLSSSKLPQPVRYTLTYRRAT